MKKLLSVTLLLFFVLGLQAQTREVAYRLQGEVVDSITREGEPYATLGIYRKGAEDQKAVAMAVTDAKGRFTIDSKGAGDYMLVVKSVSREPLRRQFSVDAHTKTVNLGTLLISDSKTELKGVEVVAYKPLVKADIDKLTYSVEDDPASQTNTVIDMLKKVPMVTVDGQDNIKVNGSSSFKVYVNGKPNNMMTNKPSEVFKSMPATSIKKIEVITNPGPKYDAEGIGGILNIITEGKGPEGYIATFSLNGNNRGGGGGVFATVKKGKLTFSLNYNNNFDDQGKIYKSETQSVLDDSGNAVRTTTEDGYGKNKSQWHGGSLEASYEIDTLRLLSASFSLNRYSYKSHALLGFTSVNPMLDNKFLYSNDLVALNKGTYNDISVGLDYQRSFKTKGRLLTLSYRMESNPSTSTIDLNYINLRSNDDWKDYISSMKDVYSDGDQNTSEHTFQIDYTTPFAKWHTLETGVKYILRHNRAFDDKSVSPSGSGEEKTYDADNSSHYKHRNDIFAAYMGYGLSLKKWSARLGLRYEHTLQKVEYLLGRGTDFRKNFDDLVPSAKLGYKFSDTQTLSLNYKMRISRPGIWYLNPYLADLNREQVSQGNPNLESEKNHSFDLQFGSFGQKLSYNIAVGYNFTNNSIQSLQKMVVDKDIVGYQNPTGAQVLYSTYYNMGRNQEAMFTGYLSLTPWQDTRLTVNTWGGYRHITDGGDIKNHGWNVSVYAQLQQTIDKTWTVSLSIFKMTPNIKLQGKDKGYFSHDINLKKSLLDDRLNITVSASNPFRKYFYFGDTNSGNNFSSISRMKYNQQRFAVSVSYRIGSLNDSVKKTKRTIENDDVKSGGGNSNGGGAPK